MAPEPTGVRALILDCDGVLTDGALYIDDDGREFRRFSVRDGFAIALWKSMGLAVGVISGRGGASLLHRMKQLGVTDVVQSSGEKASAVRETAARLGVGLEHCAFVGDDWPDLSAMAVVGYPIAVGDAVAEVKAAAVWVAPSPGGHGAVREAVEHILRAQGRLEGGAAQFAGVRSKGALGPTAG